MTVIATAFPSRQNTFSFFYKPQATSVLMLKDRFTPRFGSSSLLHIKSEGDDKVPESMAEIIEGLYIPSEKILNKNGHIQSLTFSKPKGGLLKAEIQLSREEDQDLLPPASYLMQQEDESDRCFIKGALASAVWVTVKLNHPKGEPIVHVRGLNEGEAKALVKSRMADLTEIPDAVRQITFEPSRVSATLSSDLQLRLPAEAQSISIPVVPLEPMAHVMETLVNEIRARTGAASRLPGSRPSTSRLAL